MKNLVELLDRQEIPEFVDPDKILAKTTVDYVRDHLGYRHPDDVGITGGKLGQTLKIAGIKPLTQQSVLVYQTEMVNRYEPNLLCRSVAIGGSGESILSIGAAVAIYFLSIFLLAAFKLPSHSQMLANYMAFFIGSAVITVLFVCWLVVLNIADKKGRRTAKWIRYLLDGEYKKPIPRFVLDNVTEIHQRLPDVKFFVEELTFTTHMRTRLVIDPFLIVIFGIEQYHIDVWDEPDFNAKRKA